MSEFDHRKHLVLNLIGLVCQDMSIEMESIWEMKRLQTLTNWKKVKPSAKEIAEAGFYCPKQETPDSVKCFCCFIELDGWETTDVPWKEHQKRALALSPPCKFIEIGKIEQDLLVKDYLDILKSVMLRKIKEKCDVSQKIAIATHQKNKRRLKKDLKKLGIS